LEAARTYSAKRGGMGNQQFSETGLSRVQASCPAHAAIATSSPAAKAGGESLHLFNDLIRPQQQRRRDGEAERLGGLEVDYKLKLARLLAG
jgi:hypothetical protein